jgi:hypothetical protein
LKVTAPAFTVTEPPAGTLTTPLICCGVKVVNPAICWFAAPPSAEVAWLRFNVTAPSLEELIEFTEANVTLPDPPEKLVLARVVVLEPVDPPALVPPPPSTRSTTLTTRPSGRINEAT